MTDSLTMPQFIITRWFESPVERVFDAWADVGQYCAWSGPKGSTAPHDDSYRVAAIDRPGHGSSGSTGASVPKHSRAPARTREPQA